jgi:spore germination protein YaaH
VKSNFKKILLIIIAAILFCAAVFFFPTKHKSISIKNESLDAVEVKKENLSNQENKKIFVSAWIPYWAKDDGAKSLAGNFKKFNQLHPFAFGVDTNGILTDVLKISQSPWPNFIAEAKENNVEVVPTILWGDAKGMHDIFSNPEKRKKHIDAIVKMLVDNSFAGVDIDYEGKDIADKDNFSSFITDLSQSISASGKTLNCTIEARTQDQPLEGQIGVRGMSWANDYTILNKECDSVTVMAYDQIFQINRANSFSDKKTEAVAPNATNSWTQDVVKYALKYIAPEKLILGVSTYGWEFKIKKNTDGFDYTRVKSVSYREAMEKAKKANVLAKRIDGEMSFVYKIMDGEHLVSFDDAVSLKDKIEIAKRYNLKGIDIFKLDGLADPEIYNILSEHL